MRVLEKIKKQSYKFDLYKLLEILEKSNISKVSFGDGTSQTEPAKIACKHSLNHIPSDIDEIQDSHGKLTIYSNIIGLTNANSPLDTALIEQFLLHNYDSKPLADFLDIINHRIVSLFYKTHKTLKSYPSSTSFKALMKSLANNPLQNSNNAHASYKQLNFAWPSFYNTRSVSNYIKCMLNHDNVSVIHSKGSWIHAANQQMQLNLDRLYSSKDHPKILGTYIFQSRFGLHCKIICSTYEQYLALLPGSQLSILILQNIQFHLPVPAPILLELTYYSDVLSAQMGQLGQTSSIGDKTILHSSCFYNVNHHIFTQH